MSATTTQNGINEYAKAQQNQAVGKSGVISAIKLASARTGVDFAYLLNKADQESSLNPNAQASTSSASGLFQFIKSTWFKMVKDHGAEYGLTNEASAITEKNGQLSVSDPAMRQKILNMRHDPVLSSAMAAEFTKENKDYLDASVGGNIGSTELYMAHFLGAGGASTFLNKLHAAPNAAAADFLPDAAQANPNVFYSKTGRALSLKEIYNHFAAKFDSKPSSNLAVASAVPPTSTRDLAAFSSAFYHEPAQSLPANNSNNISVDMDMLQQVLKQNNNTADTLFNTMMLAQMHINDALTGAANNDKSIYISTVIS
ncbi:MAG: transglycosylase SLT domain-containing protein [Alphaproteobacteria bacterium]|nr:transglycosylase SLT domain-containing protein [Alphaproteobacteria bacterium]